MSTKRKRKEPWRVSLHGGHSKEFCDHGRAPLRKMLERAIEEGFTIYGVTEHAPRVKEKCLFPKERAAGWSVETLRQIFDDYCSTLTELAQEFSADLEVLRGFEAEMVPVDSFKEVMLSLKEKHQMDYLVASVHWVHEELILSSDINPFNRAMEICGSYEAMACQYFESVALMTTELRPEVVGHFDVIRRHGDKFGSLEEPSIKKTIMETLELVKEHNAIIDVNLAAYRRGFDTPFPLPWIVKEAHRMGIGLCFGDDSHSLKQVGQNMDRARQYLLDQGVRAIRVLRRRNGQIVQDEVPLI